MTQLQSNSQLNLVNSYNFKNTLESTTIYSHNSNNSTQLVQDNLDHRSNTQLKTNFNIKRTPHYFLHSNNIVRRSIVEIVSINTHGINKNFTYLNKAAEKYDVMFLMEHWQTKQEKLEEIFEKPFLFDFHFWPATKKHKIGRGSKGIAFITKSELEAKHRFVNNRIAILYVKNLAIIGVYMIYEKRNNETLNEFVLDIQRIIREYRRLYNENYQVLLTGDWNTDFRRDTEFTHNLNDMMKALNLTSIDTTQPQQLNYSFIRDKTWIDHSMIDTRITKNCIAKPYQN